MKQKKLPALLIAALTTLAAIHSSLAGESGQSEYLPGFTDLASGYLGPPGFYLGNFFTYQTSSVSRQILREGRLEANVNLDAYVNVPFIQQVTHAKVLGATYAWRILLPVVYAQLAADVAITGTSLSAHKTGSMAALGDIYVMPIVLGWETGFHHFTFNSAFYAPSGQYSVNDFVNVGKNRWAIEEDVAYTYLNMENGRELSVFGGWTDPFNNSATNYTSGSEIHVDYALAQHLPNGLAFGPAGYYFQQITSDTGSGAKLGSLQGYTVGLGPIVSWVSNIENPISLSFKYQWDLATSNRFSGQYLWFDFAMKL